MVFRSLNRIFAVENLYTMRKIVHYIILLTLVLSACTSPSHEAMRQRLKYVSDCNRADTVFTERWLPTVDSLVAYFDRHGSANDRTMAHYVQGRVYHDMGEAPQALECYQRAAEVADTTSADCDFLQLSRVYALTAHLFLCQNLPANALSELSSAAKYALRGRDSITYISSLEQMAVALYEQQDFDQATDMGKTVFSLYYQVGDTARAFGCLPLFIMSALRHNDTGTAGKWLKLYEEQSGFVNENFLAQKGHESYYALKGNYLLQCGEITTAEIFFRRLMTSAHQPEMSLRAYQGLYETFSRGGQRDSTAKYAVLYSQYNDSSTMALRSRELQQLESLYNYSHSKKISAQMAMKAAKAEKTVLSIVFLLSVSILIAVGLLLYYLMKVKSRMRNASLIYFTLLIRYLREHMRLQLMIDEDSLNRNNIEEQQKKVNVLKRQMAVCRGDENEAWNVDDMLLGSQTVLYFHEMAAIGKRPKNEDWISLRQSVNDFLPGFIDAIGQQAMIGNQETNICIFVKLLFSPSEICSLLDLKPQALTNMRTRLLWKLFRKRGGAKDFDLEIRRMVPPK